MISTVQVLCLPLLIIAAFLFGPAFGQDSFSISCSPDRPVLRPGDTATLNVWADAARQGPPTYEWESSAGKIRASGSSAIWNFSGVEPGTHNATAFVAYGTGETDKCTIQVLVELPQTRGGISGLSFLTSAGKEKSGYGLYSYILFGSRPTDATRERYLKTLEAYGALVESIASLEASGIAKHRLNITYLPVGNIPSLKESRSPKWLLANYNFPVARAILSALPGDYRADGPYIVSHLKPLSRAGQIAGKYLYQDLSAVMPKVVIGYAREFMNQAAQQRHWEERTARQLALKLQNTLHLMAQALPEVTAGIKEIKQIKDVISWKE